MRGYLNDQLCLAELPARLQEANAALASQVSAQVRSQPADVAIDLHDRPYYGKLAPDEGWWVCGKAKAGTTRTLDSPKALVRVATNSAALVHKTTAGTSLLFGPCSALTSAAVTLRGVPAIQLPLGFHRPCKTASDATKLPSNAQYLR